MDTKIEASKLLYKKIKEVIFFIRRSPKDMVATLFATVFFYWGLWLYDEKNSIPLPASLGKDYQNKLNDYQPFVGIFLFITAFILIAWVIYSLWKIALPPIIPDHKLSHAIKGLMPFDVDDGELFSKLERHAELSKLSQHINSPQENMIVFMGESGAGKSSLLRAGLTYILDSKQCTYIYWEAFPDEADVSLLNLINSCLKTKYQQLEEVLNHQTEVAIVLDQFEQLSIKKHPEIFALLTTIIKQSPPHKVTWIVAFRREYDPEWRDFELSFDNRYQHLPMLSLKLFSPAQAKNIFTILAGEAGLTLNQDLVDSFIDSMQDDGELSPVDISIALLTLNQLASKKQKTHLNLEDYQFAGGSEGLFVGFINRVVFLN